MAMDEMEKAIEKDRDLVHSLLNDIIAEKMRKKFVEMKNILLLYLIRPATPLLASAPGRVLSFYGYAVY